MGESSKEFSHTPLTSIHCVTFLAESATKQCLLSPTLLLLPGPLSSCLKVMKKECSSSLLSSLPTRKFSIRNTITASFVSPNKEKCNNRTLNIECHWRLTFSSWSQPQAEQKIANKLEISFFEYRLKSKGARGLGWFVAESSLPVWGFAGQMCCHLCFIPPHHRSQCLTLELDNTERGQWLDCLLGSKSEVTWWVCCVSSVQSVALLECFDILSTLSWEWLTNWHTDKSSHCLNELTSSLLPFLLQPWSKDNIAKSLNKR